MKLPHRTNHDDDDDGDDAKKQHSAPRSIVPLSMFECFKVRQNRLDSGNHQTRFADATCVWQARQFQKVKKSNFKQSQHKRSLEVRLVSFFLSGITMLEENIYCSTVLKKSLKSFCAFIKKSLLHREYLQV